MKQKKKMGMIFVLMALALVPMIITCIVVNIFSIRSVKSIVMDEIESKLHTAVMAVSNHYGAMAKSGDGSWVMDGETLVAGGIMNVAPSEDFFFSMTDEDVFITLFWGDTRYGTSIRNEKGELVIGTKASDAVIKDVLKGGKNKFIDHVEIVGQDFSGYYMPLKDASNTTVGMVFAGTPYADTEKLINAQTRSQIITVIISVLIFGAVAAFVAFLVNRKIKGVADQITVVAGGNFSSPIEDTNKIEELSKISRELEEMRLKLREAIERIIEQAEAVDAGAVNAEQRIADSQSMTNDISNAVNDIAEGATAMAQDVQNANDLTINIGNSIDEVLASASANIDITDTVFRSSTDVQGQVEKLQKADKETDAIAGKVQGSVNETARVVEEISNAAEAIISIASETNLLALNASIEAARAGEAGKGFAVVADNIKNLAEESDKSAKEITDMLSRISTLSDQNKQLTQTIKDATSNESVAFDKMSDSFKQMGTQLQESEEGSKKIETLVEAVERDKNEILNAIESLSSISEENAASTEETSASLSQLADNMESVVEEARNLRRVAGELKESISFFRI
ncbi:MAG: cache domain-containing protein [Lachnospiraceae bacterium]|nr:cache domain-containing protein [Lachnospiraceae bacterium]